jgi:cysteinyl-tRNA synthetase
MKRILLFLMLSALLSCGKDDETETPEGIDLRQEMRDFVTGIAAYARSYDQNFIVIPQNGIELVSANGEADGPLSTAYVEAINGHGQEDLFYGYDHDDRPTPDKENQYLRSFLDKSRNEGNIILVTDYCSSHSNMDDSYAKNHAEGYVSFAADHRELDHIPGHPQPIYGENNRNMSDLADISNFLYLINPENFNSREEFIQAVTATNYDLVIMDLFFHDNTPFTASEVEQLKNKANGGRRLVVCYMSIGEAENYRYYWQSEWNTDKPSWLDAENPDWEGNYKVKYWEKEWQDIIYGNEDSYLKKIIDAGFDGTYLDIIDAFEYFE